MISRSCSTSGVRSASGMSGKRSRMARFYQLLGPFAHGYCNYRRGGNAEAIDPRFLDATFAR